MQSATFRKWLAEHGCRFDLHEHKRGEGPVLVTVHREGRKSEVPLGGSRQDLEASDQSRCASEKEKAAAALRPCPRWKLKSLMANSNKNGDGNRGSNGGDGNRGSNGGDGDSGDGNRGNVPKQASTQTRRTADLILRHSRSKTAA